MRTASRFIGRWIGVCGLLGAMLWLAGCHSGPQFGEVPGISGQGAPATGSAVTSPGGPTGGSVTSPSREFDMIHPGDSITITLSDLPIPTPPMEERVREDGTITLLQNQPFTAAGKTFGQLAKEVRERYVPRFYVTMTVSIKPKDSTQFYYVGGEVKLPNRQVYISRLTVLGAIRSSGDFTDFARKKAVILTRADGRKFTVNCVKAQQDPALDLEVLPGDKIWVPRRNPIY